MNQDRVARAAPWITRRLRVGLAWLWEGRRQRRGALITEHGICSSVGKCHLVICLEGYKNMPVVALETAYRFTAPEGYLTSEEAAIFTGLVEKAAWRVGKALVQETWGGVGQGHVSLQLSRRCGRGPLRLVETYRKGCPKRGHKLLCSWDGCTWTTDGYEKARLPNGWR